jgi:hypothetical protein
MFQQIFGGEKSSIEDYPFSLVHEPHKSESNIWRDQTSDECENKRPRSTGQRASKYCSLSWADECFLLTAQQCVEKVHEETARKIISTLQK